MVSLENNKRELVVPYSRARRVPAVMLGIFTLATALAVFNLARYPGDPMLGTIASVAWLLLVALGICVEAVEAGGIKQLLINAFGLYARRQFVVATGSAVGAMTTGACMFASSRRSVGREGKRAP